MDTILVMTDFSDVSAHAAQYACALSRQLNSKRLVLYHTYEVFIPSAPSAVVGQESYNLLEDYYSPETDRLLKESSLQRLEEEKTQLMALVHPGTVIEYAAENMRLVDGINEAAMEYQASLVVIGTAPRAGMDRVFMENNVIEVADDCRYPVLIVPIDAPIEPITKIVFACDLEKVQEPSHGVKLKKLLDEFKASLMVVHVDKEQPKWAVEAAGPQGMTDLIHVLEAYSPTFDFVENNDIVAGITAYSEQHRASLILVIGKNHGFFRSLFHQSVTHHLAYQSHIPLLVVHGKKLPT
jgi:nucleotide-binding universal stress UspA family protein